MSTQPDQKSTKPPITHTPGPWKVATRLYSEKRGVICVEHACWDALDVIMPHWANSETPDEHFANARLIAAAPDLLAACKSVVGSGYYMTDPLNAPQDYVGKMAIENVRAAIAKAEGFVS